MDSYKLFSELLITKNTDELTEVLKKNNLWDNQDMWRYYGDIDNNVGQVHGQQSEPVKAFVEKLTNSIDAILVLMCRKYGLDPTDWDNVPRTVSEAVKKFITENKNRELSLKEIERQIYVFAEGYNEKGKFPNLCIYDNGEGQTPVSLPDTIVSLGKSNKKSIPFLQGQYNMGGSGVSKFCKDGLQLIVTKKNPYFVNGKENPWSFTVVRRNDPDDKKHERNQYYTYLAPIDFEKKPKKGGVLNFVKDELPLIPKQNKTYQVNCNSGTLIKCYEYEIKKKSNILFAGEFLSNIETMMPDCALPVRFAECRAFKGKSDASFETSMVGLIKKLDRSGIYKDTLEHGFPIKRRIDVGDDSLPLTIYAFQRQKKQKSLSVARTRRLDREGIIFTVNGQHYFDLPFNFFARKSVKLATIAQDIIAVLDFSNISNKLKNTIFMSNKENVAKTAGYRDIEKQLESIFRTCEELKLLQNKRTAQDARNKVEDNKTFDELMSQLLNKNPALAELFGVGHRLTSAFNMQQASNDKKDLDLKEFPTYFKFKKLESGEKLKRTATEDKPIRLSFETDAENEYFDREERNGSLKVLIESDKFKDSKIIYSTSLKDGICSLNIAQPDNAEPNDVIEYKFIVKDLTQDQPFINFAKITVTEKSVHQEPGPPKPTPPRPPKPPIEGEKKDVPGGLNIPEPTWVKKENWAAHDFEEFDEFDGLTVQYVGEDETGKNKVDKYNYYINSDNFYLLNELKLAKDNMREVIKERYKTSLVLSAVSILAQSKLDKTDEDQEADIKKVRMATRALSRIILPLIQVLGSLSEQDLTLADD